MESQEPELTAGFKYAILPELSLSGPSAFQQERKKAAGVPYGACWGFLGDWGLPRVPEMPAEAAKDNAPPGYTRVSLFG